MTSSSPNSSKDLDYCYPPVQVNRSLADLDLDTLMMRSNTTLRLPEEVSSNLEESSYEVWGSSVYETSDDEGNTESVASTDGQTPDDISSLSEDDDSDDEYMREATHIHRPAVQPTNHETDRQPIAGPEDSVVISTSETQKEEADYNTLYEVTSKSGKHVDAYGYVGAYNETTSMPEILKLYGCPEIRFSMKMALSTRHLPEYRSFRLLYIGEFDEWAVNDVVSPHIGAALNATPTSSRFNVVQGSELGTPTSSRVQLERSGPELVVDHCTSPKLLTGPKGTSRVSIALNDGTTLELGPGISVRHKSLPDLVIFCHSENQEAAESSSQVEKFNTIRAALYRQRIPSLDIARVSPHGSCPKAFTFNAESLRVCVEGRHDHDESFETQATLPIDVYTFCNIDPSQLNRHLAYIKNEAFGAGEMDNKVGRWEFLNLSPKFKGIRSYVRSEEMWARRNSWLPILTLLATVMLYYALSAFVPGHLPAIQEVVTNNTVSPTVPLSTADASRIAISSTSSLMSSTPIVRPTPKDLSVVVPEKKVSKSWRDYPLLPKQDPIGSFEIEATGDHQFTLRPSKELATSTHKDVFRVQVSRDSEAVPVTFSRSADGLYVVDLEQEYSVGMFNVSVVARRRPLLQFTFDIKLGSEKSRLKSLADGVEKLSQDIRHDLAVAQTNLKNLSSHLSKGLYTGLIRIPESAVALFDQTQYWKPQHRGSSQSIADHLREAKQATGRQLDVGSKVTKEVSNTLQKQWKLCASKATNAVQEVKADMWTKSRPFRTSPQLRRARNNALSLRDMARKKLGMAKGARSKEPKEQERSQHNKCGRRLRCPPEH
jgi:hypothetical protein